MSISKRLKGPTPIFFQKLRRWLIAIGGALTGFGGTLIAVPSLPDFIKKVGACSMTVGIVVGALGSFLTSLPLETNQEAKEEAKEEVKEQITKSLENEGNESPQ